MRKKFVQKCDLSENKQFFGRRLYRGKKSSKVVEAVFNKFYKDQVRDLYKAVMRTK